LDDGHRLIGIACVLRATHKARLPPSAASVVWMRTMWGGLGQVFGACNLFTTHGVTIANGVHDIVPGLSFPVIVTHFGAREVIRRQRANVGYTELLTTGNVQVPQGAPHGTTPAPDFTAAVVAEGVVGAVASTRCDFVPGQNLAAATLTNKRPITPARPRNPGKRDALPAAAPPAAPLQCEDVDLLDANPALHDRIRRMLGQHKNM